MRMLKKLSRMILFFPIFMMLGVGGGDGAGAGSGAGSEGADDKGAGDGGSNGGEGDKTPPASDKTHTQADVDKAVKDRLAREQKKHDAIIENMKKAMNPDAGGAPATNPDGTPAANPHEAANNELANKAAAALVAANQRLVQATALSEAIKLGVDPKYTADAVILADLSKIEVNDDGSMDTGAISKAIDEVIKRMPVLKLSVDNSGGFKIGGEGQKNQGQNNGWGQKGQGQNNGQNNQGSQMATKSWNRQNR